MDFILVPPFNDGSAYHRLTAAAKPSDASSCKLTWDSANRSGRPLNRTARYPAWGSLPSLGERRDLMIPMLVCTARQPPGRQTGVIAAALMLAACGGGGLHHRQPIRRRPFRTPTLRHQLLTPIQTMIGHPPSRTRMTIPWTISCSIAIAANCNVTNF